TACGDDDMYYGDIVGAACRDDLDCAPGSHCERGGDFPDGTCTLVFRDHYDCPRAASCVDKKGGIRLPGCLINADCRPGYRCRGVDNENAPGSSRVCIR